MYLFLKLDQQNPTKNIKLLQYNTHNHETCDIKLNRKIRTNFDVLALMKNFLIKAKLNKHFLNWGYSCTRTPTIGAIKYYSTKAR